MHSGAGNGMAGMAAAIPIWNLVWRCHTNLLKFGQLIFRKIIKIVTRGQILKPNVPKSILPGAMPQTQLKELTVCQLGYSAPQTP